MKAIIKVGSRKERFTLTGRNALAFKNWWDNGPSLDAKGKPVKVELYQGYDAFTVLPGGARGGFTRAALVVKFEGVENVQAA